MNKTITIYNNYGIGNILNNFIVNRENILEYKVTNATNAKTRRAIAFHKYKITSAMTHTHKQVFY